MRFSRLAIAALGASTGALLMAGWITSARAEPSRIVSVGGDVTEILYALGQQARIVAVDATSQFPPEALIGKKSVGYMRALSTEGVISIGADLAIASERAGPPEVVKALKSALAYVDIPEGTSAEGVPLKIRAVAAAAGVSSLGNTLADQVTRELDALKSERIKITKPLRALFVLSVQAGRITVGGDGSSADAILKLAGLENAASAISGFKPVGDEALINMMPDIIVTMRRGAGGHDTEQVLALPGLAASPAGQARRVVVMDGLYLLGFGPRVAGAARELMATAYPEFAQLKLKGQN
jgi:iron complex transport system substrate-binding protein